MNLIQMLKALKELKWKVNEFKQLAVRVSILKNKNWEVIY